MGKKKRQKSCHHSVTSASILFQNRSLRFSHPRALPSQASLGNFTNQMTPSTRGPVTTQENAHSFTGHFYNDHFSLSFLVLSTPPLSASSSLFYFCLCTKCKSTLLATSKYPTAFWESPELVLWDPTSPLFPTQKIPGKIYSSVTTQKERKKENKCVSSCLCS